jgi:prepilin-type N-terminal cleavage/methylation domain-containing protein
MARTMQPPAAMHNPFRRTSSAGFSLVEMLIVCVIIGLVTLFAFPRAGVVLDHTQVRGARTAIVNKLNATRIAARTSNRVAVLRMSGSALWLELNSMTGSSKTVLPGGVGLHQTYGVDVTGPDSVKFDPRGLSQSGTQTYVITRNGWSDSVTINGYGRITR